MAALSLVAGVTMGATKLISVGGKVAKAAKTVAAAGNLVSNTATFAMCAVQTVKTGSAMYRKYHEEGISFNGETAMEMLAIGLNAAGMVMSGKGIAESGNRLSKAVKESGVTNKIAGKVKSAVVAVKNDNRGIVDFEAPIFGSGNGSNTKIKINEKNAGHIFRNAEGHFVEDTAQNRVLLEHAANDKGNFLGLDKYGNEWYAEILDDESQVWVQVRNGEIRNGGVNNPAKTYNSETGLSNPNRPTQGGKK